MLSAFLASASHVVVQHGGIVVGFTGDGLLAVFGAPVPMAEPELAAFTAAATLKGDAGPDGLPVRVGLATGPTAYGTVGSGDRQAFTIYGETVNRASRLEQLAKGRVERIVLDGATGDALDPQVGLRTETVKLRGTSDPVPVWFI